MMVCLSDRKAFVLHSTDKEVLQTLLIAERLNIFKDRNDLMQPFSTFLTPMAPNVHNNIQSPPSLTFVFRT